MCESPLWWAVFCVIGIQEQSKREREVLGERERKRVSVRKKIVRERKWMWESESHWVEKEVLCVRKREGLCVWERKRNFLCVTVAVLHLYIQKERERVCRCVYLCDRVCFFVCIYVFLSRRKRERVYVCVCKWSRERERERERKREMGEVEMGAGEIRESRSCCFCFCCCYSAKHLNEQMCLVFFMFWYNSSRLGLSRKLRPPGLPNGGICALQGCQMGEVWMFEFELPLYSY